LLTSEPPLIVHILSTLRHVQFHTLWAIYKSLQIGNTLRDRPKGISVTGRFHCLYFSFD